MTGRRVVTLLLLAVAVAGTVLVLAAGARQASPNATRAVIGARQGFCTVDRRWFFTGHSGWLPTENCIYPAVLPPAGR